LGRRAFFLWIFKTARMIDLKPARAHMRLVVGAFEQ
jgi:hypothetical protein